VLTATNNRRRHAVDIDDTVAALLVEHRVRCFGDAVADRDGFVFTNDAAGRIAWKPNWVTKTFLRHQRALGLRAFRLHDLRHFMATQMLDLGIPVTVVARRLDHRRVSTTLDFYSHVITGRDRFAADSLAAILQGARPGHH
jgi:integrase